MTQKSMTQKSFKRRHRTLFLALVVGLVVVLQPSTLSNSVSPFSALFQDPQKAMAQGAPTPLESPSGVERPTIEDPTAKDSDKTPFSEKDAVVKLGGETLFTLPEGVAGISAEQRVQGINAELQRVADDLTVPFESIQVRPLENIRLVVAAGERGDRLLFALVQEDASRANKSIDGLANDYKQRTQTAIRRYREARSSRRRLRQGAYTVSATIVAILLIGILNKLWPRLYEWCDNRQRTLFQTLHIQRLQLIISEQILGLLKRSLRLVYWFLMLLILYLYISRVLSFFPNTEGYSQQIIEAFQFGLVTIYRRVVRYLPNLLVIALIVVATRFLTRLLRVVFGAIVDENLSIPGFYSEWAEPTSNILNFLLIAFAVTLIIPYLPGSGSGAFQGVSLFLGAIVTFGSAGAISNLVGGFISLYGRSFQQGDRISIGEFTGTVMEKTLLSTRLLTPNHEIITIPNSIILGSSVINYSATLRELKQPLTLHTTITLGYDMPWRQVHEVLISAARGVPHILDEPSPQVWQTGLDDFYVSYELRAHTNQPDQSGFIYSALHQAIQDGCNTAGIEILSPHYGAIRDGAQTTIPANYLSKE